MAYNINQSGTSADQLAEINQAITGVLNQISAPGGDNQQNRNEKDRLLGMRDRLIQTMSDEAETQKLFDETEGLYAKAAQGAIDETIRNFAPQRSRLVAEEMALGRGDSPVSRYALGRADDTLSANISNILSQSAGRQAGAKQDWMSNLKNLGFERTKLAEQMRQSDLNRELQSYLGRREIDTKGKDFWDKLTAVGSIVPKSVSYTEN